MTSVLGPPPLGGQVRKLPGILWAQRRWLSPGNLGWVEEAFGLGLSGWMRLRVWVKEEGTGMVGLGFFILTQPHSSWEGPTLQPIGAMVRC